MFLAFFYALRSTNIPISVREYLELLSAFKAGILGDAILQAAQARDYQNSTTTGNVLDDFYYLSRTILVKDEKYFDRFDRTFSSYFKGLESLEDLNRALPDEWLYQQLEKILTPEEMAQMKALPWDELMKTLAERLKEQNERHQGGNKWIGTGGTSPFGAYGYNPAGIRIGQKESRHRRAVKVWDERKFTDYDEDSTITSRNIQVALKRLRRFARMGASEELDLDSTIRATARNAGFLDVKMRPERHNAVKVLLLLDVGGSMDDHVYEVAQLFSAVKTEFKHLEFYYFHNCVYDYVWKSNDRRKTKRESTLDVMHRFNQDYKLVLVGDATMSPYEIMQPGASMEYMNEESGQTWMERILNTWSHHVWINPSPEDTWQAYYSIRIMQEIMGNAMYPLTVQGLEAAMRHLSR